MADFVQGWLFLFLRMYGWRFWFHGAVLVWVWLFWCVVCFVAVFFGQAAGLGSLSLKVRPCAPCSHVTEILPHSKMKPGNLVQATASMIMTSLSLSPDRPFARRWIAVLCFRASRLLRPVSEHVCSCSGRGISPSEGLPYAAT